jgi:hypothetical protein
VKFTKKQTDKVPCLSLKNLNMKQNIENNDSRGNFFSGFKGCLFFVTGKENVYCFTPGLDQRHCPFKEPNVMPW